MKEVLLHVKANKRMKQLLLIPFLLLSFTAPSDTMVAWGSREIQWSDFKGKPNKLMKAVAVTSSTITLNSEYTNDALVLKVENFFIVQKSWTLSNDSLVLEHERGHFDLSEIYARKIRKQYAEKTFNNTTLNKEVQSIFNKLNKELENEQAKYDDETNHSINKPKQYLWSEKIKKALEELNVYSSTEVVLKLK